MAEQEKPLPSETRPGMPYTAVVPAAGMGTRFLPVTKSVPKELLPVVDTPGIELVAAEAARAGAQRLVIVTSEGKDSVVAHFVQDLVLEGVLEAKGKSAMLEKVRRAPNLIKVESVVQQQPLGLGHAIAQVEQVLHPDDDAIAILLPDDLVLRTPEQAAEGRFRQKLDALDLMAQVRAERGGSVICAFPVPTDEISAYGVFDVVEQEGPVRRVRGLVEKPPADQAPSNLAVAGRYILDRAIFDTLREVSPGAGGEIQLTDAIALLIAKGHPVHLVVWDGYRHDLGNPGGYLKASVDFALDREEYGPGLRAWLISRLGLS
ncbi:MAG: UTP--glucose-1-phosphate uridylyltransferase [Segniliparus sp.]|uniref:UTP--glucose-1-phosphate uridylyltransferase n=1 Tax=Segniliparus sp. TaxID=2804064 RepID=UPI003F401057